ncbi:MAG: hypothetical protein ACYDDV_00375 [Methanoregula sp.]
MSPHQSDDCVAKTATLHSPNLNALSKALKTYQGVSQLSNPFTRICCHQGTLEKYTCVVKLPTQGEISCGTVYLTYPGFIGIVDKKSLPARDVTSPSNKSIHIVPFLQDIVRQLRIISIRIVVRKAQNPELLSALKGGLWFPSMDILPMVKRGMT